MFARDQRLTNKRVFERIFQRGQWVKGSDFSLRILPAHPGGQIAFIVSKKVTKSAQERNRIKRQLRAGFRQALATPRFSNQFRQWYILVVVHRMLTGKGGAALLSDIETALQRIPQSA